MELSVTSPFPFEALPRVWRWIETFRDKVADDFSPKTEAAYVDQQAAKWESMRTWAVRIDGELAGLVSFERITPWFGTAHFLLKSEFHGKGAAVKAARIVARDIFAGGVGKLSFYTPEGNLAIGSLICTIGGKREGCLHAATLRGGKPIDMWVYGITKEQFEEKGK